MIFLRFKFNVKITLFSVLATAFTALPVSAIETTAKSAIIIEVATGTELLKKQADEPMSPASMSKLMTLYMLFDKLKSGALSLEDKFKVSENAWRKGGIKSGSSTMFLKPKTRVSVEDLIRGIIVQSGNDACIVVAESLSGSEPVFALEMNEKARELDMTQSHFVNSTGWPHPEHRMSPRDLAILSQRLIQDFPEYYHYFKELEFTYNGIKQRNRNPLLYKEMNADGLKTGHTKKSGYGLVASVNRRDRRIVLVINGLPSKKARSAEPERLFDWAYREYSNYYLFQSGEQIGAAKIWLGQLPSVPLIVPRNINLTLPRRERRKLDVRVVYEGPVPAPIKKGQNIAKLVINTPSRGTEVIPLVAKHDVMRLNFLSRLMTTLRIILLGESS